MKNPPRIPNEVLIIGGDHHNTLAIVRCLGAANVKIKILLHGKMKDAAQPRIAHSKYAAGKVECCANDPAQMIAWILKNEPQTEPAILFPCSDFAEFVIDTADELDGKNFILPGFKNQRGKVARLMDKFEQTRFAQEHHFPMAKTWKIETDRNQLPQDMVYPCIAKPVLSASGDKGDIRICHSYEKLIEAIDEFACKGYSDVLIQEFLIKSYEECAYGCVLSAEPRICGGMIKKVRENPPGGGGSLSYAQFLGKEEFVSSIAYQVVDILQREGYRGMFDVELFVCENGVYLNEINFRHSGNGYALLRNNVPAPLYYCLDAAGYELPENAVTLVEGTTYHMDELSDLTHVTKGRMSLAAWLKCVCQTKAFAKFWIGDLSGSFIWYYARVKNVLRKISAKVLKHRGSNAKK